MFLDLLALGVDLVAVDTGESLSVSLNGHPMSKFLFQVRLLTSQLEKDLIVHRLYQGKKTKAKQNGGRFNNGKAFYSKELKTRVRKLRCKGMSLPAIAKKLEAEGQETSSGGHWTVAKVKGLLKA